VGYAEGLRQSSAERHALRHNERRAAMSKAFVVGAGLMGAAVVAAAAFTVLVFAGLFTVSSGVRGGHCPVTLVQQPPATTTRLPWPSDARDPTPPSDSTATFPPSTTAQSGRSRVPSSNRVAIPRASASSCPAAIDIERFGPIVLGVVARSERRACLGHADDIGTRHEPRRGRPLPDATSRALPCKPSEA
jgi:hypothetical protein